jgi:hypothetical protein
VGWETPATGTAELITMTEATPRHVVTITAPITSLTIRAKIFRCISSRPFLRLRRVFTRLIAKVFLDVFGSLSVIEALPIARYESFKESASGAGSIAGSSREWKGPNARSSSGSRPRRDTQVFAI